MRFWPFFTSKKSGISSSRDLERLLLSGCGTVLGQNVNKETAMRFSAVYSAVNIISNAVAQLPIGIFKDHQAQRDHHVHKVLRNPSQYIINQKFLQYLTASALLTGNGYAYIIRNSSKKILELQIMPSEMVECKKHSDATPYYIFTDKNGYRRELAFEDVLHYAGMTEDGFNGVSVLTYARNAISNGITLETHSQKLFANGVQTSGVLKTDRAMSDESFNRLRKSFEESYIGSENSGRPLILEEGLDWKSIAMTSQDAQFLESRKFQISEIARFFNVPPHMLADLDRSTNNNIEKQAQEFVDMCLMPWIKCWEQTIERDLLTANERENYYCKLDPRALLRGNSEARAKYYTVMLQNGVMTRNEVRQLEDLPSVEGGDEFMTPANMLINGHLPAAAE